MTTPDHVLGPADLAPVPARARRIDAGLVRLSQRDIDAFLLCAEHYAAPYDLLAQALGVSRNHLNGLLHRWRRTGFMTTARLGPGPLWCWLTRSGMAATGLGFPATRPALARLAHNRAVLAARLWLASGQVWGESQAWWHSERRLWTSRGQNSTDDIPDAEIHWPSIAGSPYGGQIWAIEVELTPKGIDRTTRKITGLLYPPRYDTVVYLTSLAARSVVLQAAGSLPAAQQPRIAVRDLPATAFNPAGRR